MTIRQCVAPGLIMTLIGLSSASAQTPGRSAPSARTAAAAASGEPDRPRMTDPYMPGESSRSPYRSQAVPYPSYTDPAQDFAFSNPGGVGRMSEYYPPGFVYERGTDIVRVAGFGQAAGVPTRAEQLAAQRVGISRSQELHRHIDAYSRPYGAFGRGYGFGFGLGYGAAFPY